MPDFIWKSSYLKLSGCGGVVELQTRCQFFDAVISALPHFFPLLWYAQSSEAADISARSHSRQRSVELQWVFTWSSAETSCDLQRLCQADCHNSELRQQQLNHKSVWATIPAGPQCHDPNHSGFSLNYYYIIYRILFGQNSCFVSEWSRKKRHFNRWLCLSECPWTQQLQCADWPKH